MSIRQRNVDTSAHSGSNSSFKQIHLSGTGFNHCITDSALFYSGNAAWDTHQNARFKQTEGGVAVDILTQHLRRHIIIVNDTRLNGMNGNDISRCTTKHLLRFLSGLQHFSGKLVHCHNSRLTENQPGILCIDKSFRCSHINSHISFKYQHRFNLTLFLFPDRLSAEAEARCIVSIHDPSGSWHV